MPRNRADVDQLEALLCYMESHPKFAKGHITDLGHLGHDKYKQMWQDLTNTLNNIGPGHKTATAWMKTWKFLKNSAKKKKAKHTVEMQKTGNESPVEFLSEFDRRVASIFGKYGTGLSIIAEIGLPSNPRDAIEFNETSDDEIDECIPLYIIEAGLFRHLSSLLHEHDRTNDMLKKVFHDFGDVMRKSLEKLNCLRIVRDMKKVKHRSNQAQMKLMVEYMEKYRELANGKLIDPERISELWTRLAERLNSVGEAKDAKGWTRTWNDLVKSAQQRRTLLHTGQRNTPVPELDFRVLAITEEMPQQTVLENVSSQASQELRSHRTSPTRKSRSSNRSPKFRERSPHRSAHGSSRSCSPTPKASPYRCSNISPRYSPVRSPHRYARRSPISSLHNFPHRSPLLSPLRSIRRSPVPNSPHRSTYRSPSRSHNHSVNRSPKASHHRSAHGSPMLSPHRSARRSPMPFSHRSIRSSPVPFTHRGRSSEPGPSNRLSSTTKQVPVVDLTKRTAPSVPSSRQTPATSVKGASANTSAVVEAMDNYTKTITACVTQAIKCFQDQNHILQNGFEALGRIWDGTMNKIVRILSEERHSRSNRTSNTMQEIKTDACDDEDKWPAEYLEPELFPDDE